MHADPAREALLDAALPHVAFDGWSHATFRAAIRDSRMEEARARALCPRGALDLAVAFHERGDRRMLEALRAMPLAEMKVREKVTRAVRARIEAIEDVEAVRRGTTFFALPNNAPIGTRLIWGTADAIWDALGDTSRDGNWYTKRATLAGVYGSTVLYWLGDGSMDHEDTWAFLDRRIEDVMRIEKAKAQIDANPVLRTVFAGPRWVMSRVRPPMRVPRVDLPGHVAGANDAALGEDPSRGS
ncbi:ubiquinone biosynthesis protein COQ9 [Hasllibacter halocynthiae]|uniref:Ubiquinone biosynthesis protein COQ9 n=1 Tax=Hasllibacter halocynthiae TaxID=595589 RepID=A0A2T0X401_9RHOB|nr:COQ9 family protein [Hasllibacter halocynthiae]PRY93669.1 ubiquinone biosynthesis protein COQ9 [Hasllibacter halocynthiae]